MPEKNPFATLGFAPHAFVNLTDEDIRDLAQAQHRALAKLHHPDRGSGNATRFKEVQESFKRLEEDDEFQYWKTMFLRPRKDQIAKLQKTLEAARKNAAELQGSLVAFWQAFCQGRKVFRGEQLGHGLRLKELEEPSGFSAFNPPSATLIMIDRLEMILKEQAAREREQTLPWLNIGECFALRIAENGVLTRQHLVKTAFDPQKERMPAVRKELLELRYSKTAKNHYWKAADEPVVLAGVKLLGSIEKKYFEEKGAWKSNAAIAGLIPTDIRSDDFRFAREGFYLHEFEPFFRLIEPRVKAGRLLVAVVATEAKEPRFKVLGYVRLLLDIMEGESKTVAVK